MNHLYRLRSLKKTILVLCTTLFLQITSGLATVTANTLDEKAAPVISRKTYHYEKRDRSDVREQHFLYNKNGTLAQKKSIFGFGKTTLEYYQYDKSGKLISLTMVKNGETTSITSYEYNQNGALTKESEKYPNGTKEERLYEYSETGLLLTLSLQLNGYQIEKSTYEYDANGNKTRSEKYSKMGITATSVVKTRYAYSSVNQVIKAETTRETLVGGTVQNRQKDERRYVYDDNHRLIKEEYFYQSWQENSDDLSQNSVSAKYYIRDSAGLLVEEQFMKPGKDGTQRLVETIRYQWELIR